MTERSSGTTTLERTPVSSSPELRGGYSDIYDQVGIRMYRLPQKIVDALRNNGPSILDNTPAMEPVVDADIDAGFVSDVMETIDALPVAPESVIPTINTEPDIIAMDSVEPIDVESATTFDGIKSEIDTSEDIIPEPAEVIEDVADEATEAVVDTGTQEHSRLLPVRTVRKLGKKALFRTGFIKRSSKSTEGQDETVVNKPRKRAVAILAAFGVSAATFFGAGPAYADQVVIWGGMGDPSGLGYEGQLRGTGQIGPNDTVHRVEYPASIGPVGPVSLQQSIDIGVANGRPVLAQAEAMARPDEKIVIRGYSEGGIPAAVTANERSGGGPVEPGTVIIDNSPVSSTGLFANEDPLVRQGLDMATGMFDIPTGYRAPAGSEVRASEQDLWTYGGQGGVGELIPKAMGTFMGPAHVVQNPNVPGARVWIGPDGIKQVQWPGMGTGGTPSIMPPEAGGPGSFTPTPPPTPAVVTSPIIPETRAVSREWKERHGMELNGTKKNMPTSTYGSHSGSEDNSRTVTTTSKSGGTNRQTTSYSKKFSPTTFAGPSNKRKK